jgi:hypothetical protein
MILRRFTKHVSDQNWFAVSIDMLVVVLGILIGLQVSEWNQSRKEYNEGLYYINALNTQIIDEIEKNAAEIKASENYLDSTFKSLDILWSDLAGEDVLEVFQKLHFSAYQFWGPLKRPAALRQLIDGGKIDLIRSKEIQKVILDFEASYVDAIQQTQISYAYSKDLTLVIMNEVRYNGPRIVSNLEEMKQNKELVSALRGKGIFQRIQLEVLIELEKQSREVQEKLSSYLDDIR